MLNAHCTACRTPRKPGHGARSRWTLSLPAATRSQRLASPMSNLALQQPQLCSAWLPRSTRKTWRRGLGACQAQQQKMLRLFSTAAGWQCCTVCCSLARHPLLGSAVRACPLFALQPGRGRVAVRGCSSWDSWKWQLYPSWQQQHPALQPPRRRRQQSGCGVEPGKGRRSCGHPRGSLGGWTPLQQPLWHLRRQLRRVCRHRRLCASCPSGCRCCCWSLLSPSAAPP